ncbi:MAG: M60 family metallopeptidase [Niabella sp.]
MKKTMIVILCCAIVCLNVSAIYGQRGYNQPLETQKDSASYALGVLVAWSLKNNTELPPVNNNAFHSGIRTVLDSRPLKIDSAAIQGIVNAYMAKKQLEKTAPTVDVGKDLSMFETPLGLALKKGIKKSDIEKMQSEQLQQLATALLNKNYNKQYRYAVYNATLSVDKLGEMLMIGNGYSKYEGITGIYLPVGKHIVLTDGIEAGKEVQLLIPNWNRRAPDSTNPSKDPAGWGIKKQVFSLHNGANIIDVEGYGGLAYVSYYSEEPKKEQPVKVHFVNGAVNGYFDLAKHTDKDWNQLLDNAVYSVIDARGKHIQIAYPVAACIKYAYNRGKELISNYDSLVHLQHLLMGLVKYNMVPDNHILARVNYNYYMFRDGDGVAYMGTNPGNAMPLVVNPERVIKGDPCWGFSHEVGHVHQLRPYFNWGGMGEVSNNVFSLYATTSFGNKSRLSEQKSYQKARDSIVARGICYLQDNDVFNRLVPFWQLQLYFNGIGNNSNFYPALFEAFRKQGAADAAKNKGQRGGWGARGNNPAVYQLNFVKTACEVSKVDLTAFFKKYGFFYVGKFDVGDYGNYVYDMTQEMVDKCLAEIKQMKLAPPKIDLTTLED